MLRGMMQTVFAPGGLCKMKNYSQIKLETRKEWVTPKLKKIEVERLTSYPFRFEDES